MIYISFIAWRTSHSTIMSFEMKRRSRILESGIGRTRKQKWKENSVLHKEKAHISVSFAGLGGPWSLELPGSLANRILGIAPSKRVAAWFPPFSDNKRNCQKIRFNWIISKTYKKCNQVKPEKNYFGTYKTGKKWSKDWRKTKFLPSTVFLSSWTVSISEKSADVVRFFSWKDRRKPDVVEGNEWDADWQ